MNPVAAAETRAPVAKPILKLRVALALSAMVLGSLLSVATRSGTITTPVSGDARSSAAAVTAPAARLSDEGATQSAIRFYLARVQRDPEDTRSQNALAELYLQEVRESGNEDYLPLAFGAARASLAAVGPERNVGGLTALAHCEFSNHDFAAARDHAIDLIAINPGKSEPYAILGDAQLELGDYNAAAQAFAEMQRLSPENSGTETRLARAAFLRGKTEEATAHLSGALSLLSSQPEPPAQALAWCRWQLGETAFSTGDYPTAERFYRDALTAAPDYFRALAGVGRISAARGDLAGAITFYEQAVRIAPATDFMAALGDLYSLAGRTADAAVRYELVEQLGEHSRKVHNSTFNRNLAIFYADHDLKPEEAYTLAQGEYSAGRHDVYGADALAWTALKSGRIAEAQTVMKEALRLGTLDARLFYHAGMIARAAGEKPEAIGYLKRTLAQNPHFDPLQSKIARKALEDLTR